MKFLKLTIASSVLVLLFAQNLHAVDKNYRRIISLMPSATETLYALGLGDEVVGVTRYCKYPPEVFSKPKVGGMLDTNFESVLQLKPDLIVMSNSDSEQKAMLKKMNLNIFEFETRSIEGIIDSIEKAGIFLGRQQAAMEITQKIKDKIAEVKERTKDLKKPKVLITYIRPVGEGLIRDVYIAGNRTFFNDIINVSGAENAYQGLEIMTSPMVTAEGILKMNPDVIIEVMSSLETKEFTADQALKDWEMLADLDAYRNKRIYILNEQFIGIPGPRLVSTLEKIAKCIHPEVNWSSE